MPIRPEVKGFCPEDWHEISRRIRFDRAGGRCERCSRPHLARVLQRPDGIWSHGDGRWYDDNGRPADAPDLFVYFEARFKRVVLATAHLDHDPRHNDDDNLAALCGRCHLAHDRPEHMRRRRIYRRSRYALADLFEGRYAAAGGISSVESRTSAPAPSRLRLTEPARLASP